MTKKTKEEKYVEVFSKQSTEMKGYDVALSMLDNNVKSNLEHHCNLVVFENKDMYRDANILDIFMKNPKYNDKGFYTDFSDFYVVEGNTGEVFDFEVKKCIDKIYSVESDLYVFSLIESSEKDINNAVKILNYFTSTNWSNKVDVLIFVLKETLEKHKSKLSRIEVNSDHVFQVKTIVE